MKPTAPPLVAVLVSCLAHGVLAQPVKQEVKPPQAQAWIDVATFSGMGMPAMGSPGGGPGGPMTTLGNMFGGGGNPGGKVSFLMTQSGSAGRYVDVTVYSRANSQLAEATQEVPTSMLTPALKLLSSRQAPQPPGSDDEVVSEPQRPQMKFTLYWGCGDTVRAGQPRVIDFSAGVPPPEVAQLLQSRRATQRGAHSAAGRPHWPNDVDGRGLGEAASLTGSHRIAGNGMPEGFRFDIPAAQDLMPPLQLQQADKGGAVTLSWAAQPHARAYFAMGMMARGANEMVLWTSSELPDLGFGLMDYQTNAAVDRWLKDKVLLPTSTTTCTIPKGVFAGEGAMLRAIAYGNELNLAHPPRPTDPKVPWEPQWAVKVRVKSVGNTILGMPTMERPPTTTEAPQANEPEEKKEAKKQSPLDLLRGVLGR